MVEAPRHLNFSARHGPAEERGWRESDADHPAAKKDLANFPANGPRFAASLEVHVVMRSVQRTQSHDDEYIRELESKVPTPHPYDGQFPAFALPRARYDPCSSFPRLLRGLPKNDTD